jgi:ribA/ribD-fused uncharacterized protein
MAKPNLKQLGELRSARTGGEAKRLGRKLDLRPDWDDVKDSVMRSALAWKFSCNYELVGRLTSSSGLLVEGNSWGDTYWGACWSSTARDDQRIWANDGFKVLVGENVLGRMLMELRDTTGVLP